jgi:ribosomal protein L24E
LFDRSYPGEIKGQNHFTGQAIRFCREKRQKMFSRGVRAQRVDFVIISRHGYEKQNS